MDIEKAIEHFKQLVKTDEMAVSCLKPDETEKSIQVEWLQYNNLAITALQAYRPWIPVSERLPVSDDGHQNLVLVLGVGGDYEIEMPSHIIRNIEDYTHWKPLPEIPRGQ